MNIMDLDEAEGLTAEMLVAYLVREGYAQTTYHTTTEHWQKRVGRILYQINVLKIERSVQLLATWAKVSPQSILREMNPRLRKGKPAEDVQRAHWSAGGLWLASVPDNPDHNGAIIVVSFPGQADGSYPQKIAIWSDEDWHDGPHLEDCAAWSFWPVDAHGNKVRWPKVSP